MSAVPSLLSARGICVELGGRRVLDRVDFSLAAGEVVGLLGPNGAGKTTLLRALGGLQNPSGGSVLLREREMREYSAAGRARQIAYLPQGGQCHWPMPVEQVVALGRLPHRAPWAHVPARDLEAVRRAMRDADVSGLATRTVTELSGGERARVLLARALAVEAPTLLADEPTAGLDPAHQLGVMELLCAKAKSGTGVVVTLHDLTLATRFCSRLALLSEGRLVADAEPGELLEDGRLARVYSVTLCRAEAGGRAVVVPISRVPP